MSLKLCRKRIVIFFHGTCSSPMLWIKKKCSEAARSLFNGFVYLSQQSVPSWLILCTAGLCEICSFVFRNLHVDHVVLNVYKSLENWFQKFSIFLLILTLFLYELFSVCYELFYKKKGKFLGKQIEKWKVFSFLYYMCNLAFILDCCRVVYFLISQSISNLLICVLP